MATRDETSSGLKTLADAANEPESLGPGHGDGENVSGGDKSKGDVAAAPGQDGNFGKPNGSVSMAGQNGDIVDLNDEGGNVVEMDGEKVDGDDAESVETHDYSVGDLVWGKIKSHPWWPGQIYDPKDASDSALKFSQKGRLLVAYFGDGSFAWCLPSQLIGFAEHFENMSKQSNSKSFVNAVREAVDEIGRLVELEMTCRCVPDENRKGLSTPLAVNAGIREGVLVPEGDIGKLLSFRYDSAEVRSTVENIAVSVSFPSVLELEILKSWLSAFYRTRGSYLLPIYHEGLQIEGLEDKNRSGPTDTNDLRVDVAIPIQGPLEEVWPSSMAGPQNGQAPSEDKIYHRRKQKSVAELMAGGTSKKSQSRKRSVAREETNASNSAEQKRKVDDEAGSRNSNIHASVTVRKRGRKKTDEVSNAEHVLAEEETHKKSLSNEVEKDETDDNDGKGTEGAEDISSPRERKKSKYLSPPYTSPRIGVVNPFSKKELEKESERTKKIVRMGERMTKTAGILLESSPVVKSTPEGSDGGQLDTSSHLNPPSGKQDQKKIIEVTDVNASVNEVLTGVVSVAMDPLHSSNGRQLDLIRGFICAFRDYSYLNGASYKIYHKKQSGKKRKSWISEQQNLVHDDAKLPEAKACRTVGRKSAKDKSDTPKWKKTAWDSGVVSNDKNESDTPKRKKTDRDSVVKSNDKQKSDSPKQKKTARDSLVKLNDKHVDSLPASLIVTFAPGFSLPSKSDVISTFSKFGDLDEKETVILHDSASIQVVYRSPPGAEAALRASLLQNPFGSANVNYKLCYSLAPPVVVECSRNTSSTCRKTSDKTVASGSTGGEESQLSSIRQKLKVMTSMLEKCDGKISTEEVSKLDGEIKPLFEKISKIAEDVLY